MKTEAGWKLWIRKPSAAPAVQAARMPAASRPRSNAMTAKPIAAIAQTPEARPSTPSDRLTTFMTTTRPISGQRAAQLAEVDAADERQREVVDADAREHADQRGGDLPQQLHARREVAQVVEQPDRGDQDRGGEDAAHLGRDGQEDDARHEHAGEDRQPAEQRRRLRREPALLHGIERSDPPRDAHDERREGGRQREGDEEGEQRAGFHGLGRGSQGIPSCNVVFDAPAVLPALLTPFDERGDVDARALADHVEFLIESGVDGIMPCGTTGETALLEADETLAVVRTVVEATAGRVPVVAHVGRPSTTATARLIEAAIDAGAAGVSAIVPYYYKLGDREIVAHFRALLKAAGDTPLLAYTFPARTGNELSAEAFKTLVGDGLAGLKDSTSDDEVHAGYLAAAPEAQIFVGSPVAPARLAARRLARRRGGARQPAPRARARAGARVARRRATTRRRCRRRSAPPSRRWPRSRRSSRSSAASPS